MQKQQTAVRRNAGKRPIESISLASKANTSIDGQKPRGAEKKKREGAKTGDAKEEGERKEERLGQKRQKGKIEGI